MARDIGIIIKYLFIYRNISTYISQLYFHYIIIARDIGIYKWRINIHVENVG